MKKPDESPKFKQDIFPAELEEVARRRRKRNLPELNTSGKPTAYRGGPAGPDPHFGGTGIDSFHRTFVDGEEGLFGNVLNCCSLQTERSFFETHGDSPLNNV